MKIVVLWKIGGRRVHVWDNILNVRNLVMRDNNIVWSGTAYFIARDIYHGLDD